jgi:hypothetical protein
MIFLRVFWGRRISSTTWAFQERAAAKASVFSRDHFVDRKQL